ncbi:MAG: hypothetical protein DRH10_02590 [Deltaproteobacteria bacterium]|nr:MAG: hypothetical protein DRH10_02590 [Deltaproteobacteria bacterium]
MCINLYAYILMGIQSNTDRRKFSQLRQSLKRLSDEIRQLIDPSFSDKPVIKGTVYELKRKCGKPGCKCTQGELHSRMVVSSSEKGKTRLRVIPHGFLVEIQVKVRRYQELRRARARLVEVQRKIIQVMDEMEAMRREEIPVSGKKKVLS